MIRYRKSNRVRDIVGAFFLALAAFLLWVQTSEVGVKTGWAVEPGLTPRTTVELEVTMPEGPSGPILLEAHG